MDKPSIKIVAFAAGKSGGHILPCLTMAHNLKREDGSVRVLFFSTRHPLDLQLLSDTPLVDNHVARPLSTARLRDWYKLPVLGWQLARIFLNSLWYLRMHQVERMISTGGAVAVPACLAAWVLRIPIELWELNVESGKAIRALKPFAHTVNVCFAQSKIYLPQARLAPYPLRYQSSNRNPRDISIKNLGLDPHLFTIFVVGGSQGSLSLSMLVRAWAEQHPEFHNRIQVIHQTGSTDAIDWKAWYGQRHIPAIVFAYQDNVAPFFNAADVVISRAGAGALFECIFFEKPCIIAPLNAPSTKHQIYNAYAMAEQHPGRIFVIPAPQQHTPELLHQYLSTLIPQ